MSINTDLIMLIVSAIITLVLLFYIRKNNKRNQLSNIFIIDSILIIVWIVPLIFQILFSEKYGIDPIVFDYFAYIGICFLPVGIFFTGLIFANTKIKFKKQYLLAFVIPTITLLLIWTSKYHQLFYVNYSIDLSETVVGPFYTIYSIYTYLLYGLGIFYLLKYSIKNMGFFSKQAILFIIAIMIPLVGNILGVFKIIEMSIYLTPILFTATIVCCAFAVFKFKFLNITPIAMQRVVDRMSDSFLIINENGVVTDFNETFLKTFKIKSEDIRNVKFSEFLKKTSLNIDEDSISILIEMCQTTQKTILIKQEMPIAGSNFNIEASGIFSKNVFLGMFLLLKNVTQHVEDMRTIKDNQNTLMERERLATLGQFVGGIAHNLKTPIMSIAGATEGLRDLINEYDSSIEDPTVNFEDHHDIARDMMEWINKIKTHTEYMSDVITAVKGQAVNFTTEEKTAFTVNELLKRVNILMKHELKNAIVYLNINTNGYESSFIRGDINSLVQVINNMITNSIQAYNGKPEQNIDIDVTKEKDKLIISIKDYGNGIPNDIKNKLFKEMITTKGKNGTGLGLYMSYSTIKAHFNGNITVESKEGEGTTFKISLPL